MVHRALWFIAFAMGFAVLLAGLAYRNVFAIAGALIVVAFVIWRYIRAQRQIARARAEEDAAEREAQNIHAYHPGAR